MSRLLLCLAFGVLAPLCLADDPPAQKVETKKRIQPKYETRKAHDPDGIGKFYMGREIAQVMGYQGASWLERPTRDKEEEPAKLMKALEIKPDMVVADIGAGSGFHSFLMAPLVGKDGKIIACDIQQEMLDLIVTKAKKLNVTNIEPVKGTVTDPKLPVGGVDLILMVDVYHEFDHPYEMAEKMVDALKPGGRMVFVEFRMEDEKVPIKLVHKMTERQVVKEMKPFPEMQYTKTIATLPWQHIIIFAKKEVKKETKQ
jgi:precorrin-6B methylase 2